MTVAELLELLQDAPADAEVRIAAQPEWPVAFTVAGVTTPDDLAGETRCEEHGHYSCDECPVPDAVWIAAGAAPDDTPYAPRAAWA